jgi:hypothetical protein
MASRGAETALEPQISFGTGEQPARRQNVANAILGAVNDATNRVVKRIWYVTFWVLEILAIVGLALALTVPIQDNALREFFEWRQHPSPETYKAFVEKQRQERAVRFMIAVPFGVIAVLLTGPLRKYRRK